MHPLDGDGVTFALFAALAKPNKRLESARVNIAPTVAFESGFAKAWFTSQRVGDYHVGDQPHDSYAGGTREVKKRSGKDIDLETVFRKFTHGTKDNQIVAQFMNTQRGFVSNTSASTEEAEPPSIQLFDKKGLRDWLFNNFRKPNGILQKFVYPKGNYNTVIQAIWSPRVALFGCRRNKNNLYESHIPMFERSFTFEVPNLGDEDSPATTLVSMTEPMQMKVHQACNTIAAHFQQTDHLHITRMLLYFKVDVNNVLRLLYSTSIRVIRKPKHALLDLDNMMPSQPLNLSLRLAKKKTDAHQLEKAKEQQEMDFFDETAQVYETPTSPKVMLPTQRRDMKKATYSIRVDDGATNFSPPRQFAVSTSRRTLYSDTIPKKLQQGGNKMEHNPAMPKSSMAHNPVSLSSPSARNPMKPPKRQPPPGLQQPYQQAAAPAPTAQSPAARERSPSPVRTSPKRGEVSLKQEAKHKADSLLTLFNTQADLHGGPAYLPEKNQVALTTATGKRLPKKERAHLVGATEAMRSVWQPHWKTEQVLRSYSHILPNQQTQSKQSAMKSFKKEQVEWDGFLTQQREWMTKNGYFQFLKAVKNSKDGPAAKPQTKIQVQSGHDASLDFATPGLEVFRFQQGTTPTYFANPDPSSPTQQQDDTSSIAPSSVSGPGPGLQQHMTTAYDPLHVVTRRPKQLVYDNSNNTMTGLVSMPKTQANTMPRLSYPSAFDQPPRLPYAPITDQLENAEPEDLGVLVEQMHKNQMDLNTYHPGPSQQKNRSRGPSMLNPEIQPPSRPHTNTTSAAPTPHHGHADTLTAGYPAAQQHRLSLVPPGVEPSAVPNKGKDARRLSSTSRQSAVSETSSFLSSLPQVPLRAGGLGVSANTMTPLSGRSQATAAAETPTTSKPAAAKDAAAPPTIKPRDPSPIVTPSPAPKAPIAPITSAAPLPVPPTGSFTDIGSNTATPTTSVNLGKPGEHGPNGTKPYSGDNTSFIVIDNNNLTAVQQLPDMEIKTGDKKRDFSLPITPPEVQTQLLLARYPAPKVKRESLLQKLEELKTQDLPQVPGALIVLSPEEIETLRMTCQVTCWDCMEFIQELMYDVYSYFLQEKGRRNLPAYYFEIPKHLEQILDPPTAKSMLRRIHPEITTPSAHFMQRVGTPPWIKKGRPPTRDLSDSQLRQRQVQRLRKNLLGQGAETDEKVIDWQTEQLEKKRAASLEARMSGALERWPLAEKLTDAGHAIVVRPLDKMMDVLRGALQDTLDDTLPKLIPPDGTVYRRTLTMMTKQYVEEKQSIYNAEQQKLAEEQAKAEAEKEERRKRLLASKLTPKQRLAADTSFSASFGSAASTILSPSNAGSSPKAAAPLPNVPRLAAN